MQSPALVLAAAFFALVSGANDGASLLASNLSSKAMRPLVALLLLVVAIVVGPFVLGTGVATTLAHGLVGFEGADGAGALFLAVVVTVVLLGALARFGLPTSVTQALTGAIIGIGIGRGLPVDWGVVLRVILVLVAAPFVAGLLGLVAALALERLRPRGDVRTHLRILHAGAYLGQCVAYAANDAQKMVAIFAVALGIASSRVGVEWPVQLATGALFFVGTLVGVSRLGNRLSRLMPVRPLNAISAGYGSAVAVLGSAAIGAPVSLTQSTASALVGSEAGLASYRRVRWDQAVRILSAWVTTFPAALACAIVIGYATKGSTT